MDQASKIERIESISSTTITNTGLRLATEMTFAKPSEIPCGKANPDFLEESILDWNRSKSMMPNTNFRLYYRVEMYHLPHQPRSMCIESLEMMDFDSTLIKITNEEAANQHLTRNFHPGRRIDSAILDRFRNLSFSNYFITKQLF